jgi:hypothetical protein
MPRPGRARSSFPLLPRPALLTLLALAVASPALAGNVLTVTDCGDTLPGGAPGQLRRLITDASPGDTIELPECTFWIDGNGGEDANQTGDLDITKDLTIEGMGAGTVIRPSANLLDRAFHVQAGATVTIRNMVVDGTGFTSDGGAVLNEGTLTLDSVTLRSNSGPNGGAIANAAGGLLTVTDCTLFNNTAVSGNGGGISNLGTATILRTNILSNHAGGGGGVSNYGTLTLQDSTVSGNDTSSNGGGVANRAGTLTVLGSTISGNSVSLYGGGIANSATLYATNSTISGNVAGAQGGGIGQLNTGSAPSMTLTRVTVAFNGASGGDAMATVSGPSSGTVEGSIFSGGCIFGGTNHSNGHNIDTGGSCFFQLPIFPPDPSDLTGVADVKLGPLADNGGLTLTHMPAADSPAVDAGSATCSPANDQRGVTRPQGAACDIGAVEWTNDVIFQDGFESGDFSKWSSSSTDGGDLSLSASAALGNTGLGMQAAVNDTTALFVEDDTPQSEAHYKARFYFEPNGFDPGEAQGHLRVRLMILFDDAGTRRLSALVLRRKAGAYAIEQRCRRDDNSQADSGFFPITDAPHWFLVDWRQASGPASGDGVCSLTIDGTTLSTQATLQNNVSTVGRVRLGTLAVKPGASGTPYFDEFVSKRMGGIAPLP